MKNNTQAITLIKIAHTAIWFVMATAVFYILYCGLTGEITLMLYLASGLLIIEIIVLILNRWACPLTLVAKQVKPNWQDGDDIYLPRWLAVNNKLIFGSLLTVGALLVVFRMLSARY